MRVLLVNRSSGEPELCIARVFCTERSLGHGCLNFILGYVVAHLVEELSCNLKVAGSILDGVIGIFQ
jgi:hypothetical protein